jgi:glycosyltransferase involved in cell wall biosynthesis
MSAEIVSAHTGLSPRIVLIIPAHNEAKFIGRAVEEAQRYLSAMTEHWKIVVAEDGSTDGTPTILSNLSSKDRRVIYLHSEERLGRGFALNRAMKLFDGDGDVFCYIDADLATDMEALPTLIRKVETGFDLATGSRYMRGSKVTRPLLRMLVSRVYNILIRLIFHDTINDHQCGFKAFSRRLVREVALKCTDTHWFWDTEVIIRSQRGGFKVIEIPIKWKEKRYHQTSLMRLLQDIVIHGTGLLKLWLSFHSQTSILKRVS